MGRFVQPRPVRTLSAADESRKPSDDDNYAARVSKYIPAEVLSGYVAMSGIVASMEENRPVTKVTAWIVFCLGFVLTPAYLVILSGAKSAYWVQIFISTIAFTIWAYALGGPFKLEGIYSPQIGSLGLIASRWSLACIVPKPEGAPPPGVDASRLPTGRGIDRRRPCTARSSISLDCRKARGTSTRSS